jgi:predicted CoA-binding protein
MQEIVLNAHTVAIVGLGERAAREQLRRLLPAAAAIAIPVNPNEEHVLGQQV